MKTKLVVPMDLPQVRSSSSPAALHLTPPVSLDAVSVPVTPQTSFSRLINRGRWSLALWSAGIGSLGRLGVGLAVLGATIYAAGVMPGRAGLVEREREIAALSERVAQEAERPMPGANNRHDELERFYGLIPPDSQVSGALRTIHRISAQRGVQLDQAEYRVADEVEGRLFRYEIAFPVVGAYPQIRLFLRDVSAQLPFAVPDKIHFEHRDAQADRVRATIRLLLYSKKDQ